MAKESRSDKKLKTTLTVALMTPVVMCLIIGAVMLALGKGGAAVLLGTAVLLGVINTLTLKVLFKRAEASRE
jgi:hypothetical protein